MLKQRALKKRKFLKGKLHRVKYKKQVLYTAFLKFLMKNLYIEKQILFLSIYYLSFLLRVSSVSGLLKICSFNYSYRSVDKFLNLNRLTVYELISIGGAAGFRSANW